MGVEIQHNGKVLASVDASIYPPVPDPIANLNYNLVWQDDFETLNTNIWNVQPWFKGTSYDPIQNNLASVSNSILTLKSQYPTYPFAELSTVGNVRAADYPRSPNALTFQEGYIEARFRYCNYNAFGNQQPLDVYARPWFCMYAHETANAWPGPLDCTKMAAELDIFEGGLSNTHADQATWSVIHRNTQHNHNTTCGPDTTNYVTQRGTGFSNWHTWSSLWTADTVKAYIDGVLYPPDNHPTYPRGTRPTYDSTAQPMYLTLGISARGPQPQPTFPRLHTYTLEVDWVRVWQK